MIRSLLCLVLASLGLVVLSSPAQADSDAVTVTRIVSVNEQVTVGETLTLTLEVNVPAGKTWSPTGTLAVYCPATSVAFTETLAECQGGSFNVTYSGPSDALNPGSYQVSLVRQIQEIDSLGPRNLISITIPKAFTDSPTASLRYRLGSDFSFRGSSPQPFPAPTFAGGDTLVVAEGVAEEPAPEPEADPGVDPAEEPALEPEADPGADPAEEPAPEAEAGPEPDAGLEPDPIADPVLGEMPEPDAGLEPEPDSAAEPAPPIAPESGSPAGTPSAPSETNSQITTGNDVEVRTDINIESKAVEGVTSSESSSDRVAPKLRTWSKPLPWSATNNFQVRGKFLRSLVPGATLTFTLGLTPSDENKNHWFAIWYLQGPNQGRFSIHANGERIALVRANRPQQRVANRAWQLPDAETHQLVIKNLRPKPNWQGEVETSIGQLRVTTVAKA